MANLTQMKRSLFTIILMLPLLVAAQSKNCFYKHMEGTVDGTVSLVVDLIRIDNAISGSYYYHYNDPDDTTHRHYGKVMPLSGSIDAKNKITFTEFKLDARGAVYSGQMLEDGKINGIWQNNDSTKVLPFELLEVYPLGTMPFTVTYLKESQLVKPGLPQSSAATIELILLLPTGSEADPVKDSITQVIKEAFFSSVDSLMTIEELFQREKTIYFKNYCNTNEDLIGTEASLNWQKINSVIIYFNEKNILSFEILTYGYTGGAHGFPISEFHNISLKDGSRIKLDDIFREQYQYDLKDYINEQARSDYGLARGASLTEAGFFKPELPITDNFYLTRDGIGFFYNRYEVAPYAMGSPGIFIPFRKCKRILDIDGVIATEILNKILY